MSGLWAVLLSALTALLAAWLLTPVAWRYSRNHGLVDQPGPRRSHSRPVARGGGVAVAAALIAAVLVTGLAGYAPVPGLLPWLLGVIAFTLLGWADDHRPLSVAFRLQAQLLLVTALLWATGLPTLPVWWIPLAVMGMLWWLNLYNFMDGADGLASLHAVVMALVLSIVFASMDRAVEAIAASATAAAALGFLYWNRPPAKIFLGDSGSLMLGWALGYLCWVGFRDGLFGVGWCLILAAPFVVDATLTLAWRVLSGRRWYTAHRDHAYQRLIRCGWSHGHVLMALLLVDLGVVAPAAVYAWKRPELEWALSAGMLLLIGALWLIVRLRTAGEKEQ
ncbi:MAG: glycosyltransferase family 4 protein [Wenzhouxiangellaceae bacterium]